MDNRLTSITAEEIEATIRDRMIFDIQKEVENKLKWRYSIAGIILAFAGYMLIAYSAEKIVEPAKDKINGYNAFLENLKTNINEKSKKIDELAQRNTSLINTLKADSQQFIEQKKTLDQQLKVFKESETLLKAQLNEQAAEIKWLKAKLESYDIQSTENLETTQSNQSRMNNSQYRVSVIIYGQVATPLAEQINAKLTKQRYDTGIPLMKTANFNKTDSVVVLYNQKGEQKLKNIENLLNSIEGLKVTINDKVSPMKSADIAITFQPINTK